MTAASSDLLDLVPARRGHFAYESGHHGDLWLDLDALFVRPRRLQPYVLSSRASWLDTGSKWSVGLS